MKAKKTFPAFCLLFLCFANVNCGNILEVDQLYKNLTKSYNKEIRPNYDQSSATVLNVSFSLVALKEFEELTSKLSITGIFHFTWHDVRMRWNPQDFGGTKDILIPQSAVWIPFFVSGNPYEDVKPLGLDNMKVRYFYEGTAYWSPGDVYESTCTADVTFYPFELQNCIIMFIPWNYFSSEITLHVIDTEMNMDAFTENPTWEIQQGEVHVVESDSILAKGTKTEILQLKFHFRRRYLFFLINILTPIWIIGILNVLVFVLPAHSGERVSYSVTILLALSVFLTIVSDKLPSSSQPSIAYVSYMLLTDLVFSAAVMIGTIIGLRFYHVKEGTPVPNCLKRMLSNHSKRTKQENKGDIEKHQSEKIYRENNKPSSENRCYVNNRSKHVTRDGSPLDYDHADSIYDGRPERRFEVDREYNGKSDVTWDDVGKLFDKICFCAFTILQIVKNIFLIYIYFKSMD